MECVICNRRFPEREDYRFCDACGARLFDEKRESELHGIIEDSSRALDDLAADRAQGKVREGTYRALVSSRVRDKYEAESQLAQMEKEKGSIRSQWASSAYSKAEILIRAGRLSEAYRLARKMVDVDPRNPSSHLLMARILDDRGDTERAIRAARYARCLSPSDARIGDYVNHLESSYGQRSRQRIEQSARVNSTSRLERSSSGHRRSVPHGSCEGDGDARSSTAGQGKPVNGNYSQEDFTGRTAKRRPNISRFIRDLTNSSFLKWWYFVGTFILLAGIIGVVTWQWGLVGKYFVFALVLAANVGLYLLGHFLSKRVRLGSTIILVIASTLVPLNIYVFNHYQICGRGFDANLLGIAGSIIAAAVYAINYYRSKSPAMMAFIALTPLSALFFILRGSGVNVHFYGLWFVGLAAIYFVCGYILRRYRMQAFARTMYGVANATVLLALMTTMGEYRYFFGAGFKTSGLLVGMAAVALLIGSYSFEDKILAYISSGMIVISTYFLVQQPGSSWYLAAPGISIAAGALLLLGFVDSVLPGSHEGRPFVHVGVVTIVGVLGVLAMKDLALNLPRAWRTAPPAEIRASLLSASVVAILLWVEAYLEKRRYLGYLASSAMVYASLVFLGSSVESLPLWCLVEATVVAGILFVIGLVLEKTEGMDWGLTAYVPAFVVAGVSTAAAGILYLPVVSRGIVPNLTLYSYAPISLALTALATTAYLVVGAIRTRKPYWAYPACVTSILAYVALAREASNWSWVRELSGGRVNYGMLLVPLAALFVLGFHLLKRAGYDDLSLPLLLAFFGVSAFAFSSQFYYISAGRSVAVGLTFGAYMAIFTLEAILWERGDFLYPAILSAFMVEIEIARSVAAGLGLELNYPLFLAPVAVLLIIGGSVLASSDDRDVYGIPMLVSAAIFTVVSLVTQAVYMYQGFTYSISAYFGLMLVACIVGAAAIGRSEAASWKSLLPEVLAFTAIGHLAIGAGHLAYSQSGSFTLAALVLAGLGILLAASSVLADRLPTWLERPLQFGGPAVAATAVVCSMVRPSWDSYYANVICVAALAASFVMIDLALHGRSTARTDRGLYRAALGVYSIASTVSFAYFARATALPVTDAALLWQCASLALAAALALAGSEYLEDVLGHLAGHIFAIGAWLCLGVLLDLYPLYMGYWLAVPAVAIPATSFLHYARNLDEMAMVGWVLGPALLLASFMFPLALGQYVQTIVCMSVAVAAGAAAVIVYGEEKLAYLPLILSVFETIYVLSGVRPHLTLAQAGLWMMAPAVVYLGGGWLFSRSREKMSEIFLQFCLAMTALGTLIAVIGLMVKGSGDIYTIATMFTAAAIYACIGVLEGYLTMGHVSFLHFFTGYILIMVDRSVSSPHLYLLPMGAYLIALGYFCESRGYGQRAVRLLHLVGFTTLALSSLIPSIGEVGGSHAMILLTESLAALGVGIWQRRKVFLGCGLAFIVIDGVVRLWSPFVSLHWSIYAMLVGSLVIIAGILLETKRELLVEKGSAILDQLKLWR